MKRAIKSLAKPVMEKLFDFLMRHTKYHGGRRLYGVEELKLLREALLTQNLFALDGYMVQSFEKEFAQLYGVPYAVASTSGTAAIHTALGALDPDGGSEIITAPITDLGTVIPILSQNCIPVFADIDASFQMDPEDVERKITPRTKAIIVVHLFGNTCDMDRMMAVARKHNIPLIEDCSQAHWTLYKGRPVGTIGDIGCYSFQQSKHMTTGDGGMTITANKEYAERMKLFVDKGYARKGWGSRAYLFHAPNYRMNELTGAVGRAQLKKVRHVVETRHTMGLRMTERLKDLSVIQPVAPTEGTEHSYWLYPFVLKEGDVQAFCRSMIAKGVYAMAGYTGKPIYLCTESLTAKKTYGRSELPFTAKAVSQEYVYKEGLCPKAEADIARLVCMPWHECWGTAGLDRAEKVIRESLKAAGILVSAPSDIKAEAPAVRTEGPKKATDRMSVAIIGCGQIARNHLEAYLADDRVRIAAVADTDFSRAESFARECGAKAYRSHKELLAAEKISGVSICTVPSTHRSIAFDCLDAGAHVLCEKPLAMSVGEAEEMLSHAAQKKRVLLTAFKLRFFEEVVKAKEILEKGTLGRVLSARLLFGGYMDMAGTWFVKREISGGGVIMDNAPHAADLFRYLFGDISAVKAQAFDARSVGVEDTAKLDLQMAAGMSATAEFSWAAWVTPAHYLEIYGEEGAMLLDTGGIQLRYKAWADWKRLPNTGGSSYGFKKQIAHFIDVLEGKAPSVLSPDAGLKAQRVVEAAYRSIDKDAKVSLI